MRTAFFLTILGTCLLFNACSTQPISYQTLTHKQTYHSQKVIDKFSPSPEQQIGASFDLSFTFPAAGGTTETLQKMQQAVIEATFGEAYAAMSPQQAMDAFVKDQVAAYNDNVDQIIDDFEANETYFTPFIQAITILDSLYFANDRLAQFCTQSYVYTGGAHGSTQYKSVLYDITNNRQLTAADVFTEDAHTLQDLLVAAYLKDNPTMTKEENAETIEGIHSNSWTDKTDFAISAEGIYFNYSSYELGYYALGSPQLFLSYAQLDGLIKEDSPVYRIANTF